MRRSSHILSFLAVALFLLCAGSVTKADGVDPIVGLGGGGSQGPFNQNGCPVDTGCTITLDGTGSGIAQIINNTGFDLTSDTINVETSFGGGLSCTPDTTFGYPSVFGGGSFGTSCTYSETSPSFGSILGGQSYDIDFGGFCTGTRGGACGTGFLTKLTFDLTWQNGTTPTTPEPGTMLLLGTGLVTLVTSRKRLKSAKHSV